MPWLTVGQASSGALASMSTFCQFACHELTARETDVLGLLVRGLAGKQIARELAISPWTVNEHLHSLYRKCAVTGREELIGRLG